ncbi:MAG: 30S ribosomal protein S9, partial [Bdellovibrionales bacterium]|nr:30S ribosomal protein S9 [Bdellovibrionales bacterium]
ATGRRKNASARVYLTPAESEADVAFTVNRRTFEDYFPFPVMQSVIRQPLELVERLGKYNIRVRVSGGGASGQAGAVRHGIARALVSAEPDLRGELKRAGFLTRDPRAVERKKPGRHKARKKPQFSKR